MDCRICNSNNVLNENKIKGIWNDTDNVLYCQNCEIYFLENIPDQNKIDNYYKKEYYRHSNKIAYFLKNIFRKFRSVNQFKYITSMVNIKNKKILEIGACDGLLLNYFKKNNTVNGLEYSPVYKNIAKQKYNIDLIDKNFFEINDKFDLIIMSHVIEHLPDMDLTVLKLKSLLNDNGHIFIEVPNSPQPVEREESYVNNYLNTSHIYNFTEKSLKNIFIKYNFRIISFDRFFYNFPNSYDHKKQEEIAKIFLNGSDIKIKYILSIIFYLIKNIITPIKSYKKIDLPKPFFGLGDNLRIILKK